MPAPPGQKPLGLTLPPKPPPANLPDMDNFMPALAGAFMVPVLLVGAVPLFIYVYAIVRWRAGVGGEPGIGSYALVLMFRLFAVLCGLSALALLLYAAISNDEHEDMTRVCWPVLLSSLLFLAVQFVIGTALAPTDRYAPARRIFGGGLAAIAGLITFGALIGLLVTKWQEVPEHPAAQESRTDMMKAFGCWLVCFGGVYIATALKMAKSIATTPPPPASAAAPFA